MIKNIVLSIVVIGVIVVGGYYLFRDNKVLQTNQFAESNKTDRYGTTGNESTSTPITGTSTTHINKTQDTQKHMVTIETNYGKIVFETYTADAPKTVENFITLTKKKYYDGLTFHRVIPGFMIQGGDPKGNGTGGPGYTFADELNPNTDSYKAGYKKGIVAMANAGPNTNGSQFFIMTADYALPNNYTIFGKVVSGQDVVDKIANVKTGQNDKPLVPVVMKTVTAE